MRLLLVTCTLSATIVVGWCATTIDATKKYAYGGNTGWLDLRGNVTNGVVAGEAFLSGKAWAANFGWLDFGNGTPGNGFAYQNTSAAEFGVNHDGADNLSGYAYAANVGWINFGWAMPNSPDRPRINLLTGELTGFAYGANIGWINLGAGYLVTNTISRTDSDGDGIADVWEYQRLSSAGMPANLALLSANTDADGDGVPDYKEYIADTDPFDATDSFRVTLFRPLFSPPGTLSTVTLSWVSSDRRIYDIQATSSLGDVLFANLLANISGAPAQSETSASFSDIASPPNKKFYRVGAKLPLSP